MGKTGTILDFRGEITKATGDGGEAFNPNTYAAEHEHGVAYICPWEDPFAGFPEHSRRCARALDDTGIPVHLRSLDPSMQWHIYFEVGGPEKLQVRDQYDDLLTRSIKQYLVEIYQVVPDDELLQRLTTHRFLEPDQIDAVNRFRIISCVFERDRVSEHAVRAFNRIGQVWVANYSDQQMLERCGVERVAVVPIPHFNDDPLLKLRGRRRMAGPVRFYHIGKWEHRKAHHEMLGAFLMAFRPGEAKLYFKTSAKAPDFGDYPSSPEASVHAWVSDVRVQDNGWTVEKVNGDVYFMRQRLSAEQILQLHKMGDVYLSLSRGEGFDMPAYDAKLAGNLLVYTPSGGPFMFASSSDLLVESHGTVRCHPFYRWGEAEYLDWQLDTAVERLREARLVVSSNRWSTEGHDMSNLSSRAVGAMMRVHIDHVLRDGKIWLEQRQEREKQQ